MKSTIQETKIVHKKIVSSVRCTTFSYQLCNKNNNYNDKSNMKWIGGTSFLWANVTCEECLKLRNIKRVVKKGGRHIWV